MRAHPGVAGGLVGALALLPLAAAASQPCMPKEWIRDRADWVAIGTVVERSERIIAYPNCGLQDRSGCARWDVSPLVVKVERWERGDGPGELRLVPAWCAGDSPRETGARYRFFGSDLSSYQDQERVTGPLGPEPRLRILAPLTGARLKGKVDLVLRTTGFTPCSRLSLEVDGTLAGDVEASSVRVPLDTSPRQDGRHTLAVSAADCDGRRERASVEVFFDNLFTLQSYRTDRPWFQNGGRVGLEVEYGGDTEGIRVTAADFSGVDSGYSKGAEQVEPLGGGRFRIGYLITPGNRIEDGRRPVRVVAVSARGELTRELAVDLRNVPPSPFEVAAREGRATEVSEGYLPARLPDGPRIILITEGDGETIFPDMPIRIGLRWEAGPRQPRWLWLRPAGYSGLHRIALRPGETEETVEITFRGSTPAHRPGPVPGGQPTLDFFLEYEAPRGQKVPPAERVSAPTPVRYRLFSPPASEAERFPPKGSGVDSR